MFLLVLLSKLPSTKDQEALIMQANEHRGEECSPGDYTYNRVGGTKLVIKNATILKPPGGLLSLLQSCHFLLTRHILFLSFAIRHLGVGYQRFVRK